MAVTVLLIEDYSSHRVLLHRAVSEMGCQALEASDGRSGLELAREQNPHLVVLDLVLPDLDGLEVLRRLRRDPLTARTPVLIVTAVDRMERLVEALGEGADDYITKPFSPPVLQARMKVLLRAARLQRQLTEEAQRAMTSASMARAAATSDDLEAVARQVAQALRGEGELAKVALYAVGDEALVGPLGLASQTAREHSFEDVNEIHGVGPVLSGEEPFIRRPGARLGPLGRGFEGCEAALLPLHHGDRVAALAVVANDGLPVTEGQVKRLAELSEPAALALSTVLSRVRRNDSEARYRTLFEQAADGVVVLNPETSTCTQVNHTLASWMSAMPSALVGRPFGSLFAGDSQPRAMQALMSATNGRPVHVPELRLQAADGQALPVEMTVRRLRHALGAELLIVLHDLRSHGTAGESGTVARPPSEGHQPDAARDLALLARTVRALNHSINNPLTCIIGLTQLLQLRLKDQPDHQTPLETILTSAERITDLCRQLRESAVALGGDEPLENVEELLNRHGL